jgi:hypothetical protein
LNGLLLFAGQEESFVRQLSDLVDQTNSMENVAAVEDSNVLVGNQDRLFAN